MILFLLLYFGWYTSFVLKERIEKSAYTFTNSHIQMQWVLVEMNRGKYPELILLFSLYVMSGFEIPVLSCFFQTFFWNEWMQKGRDNKRTNRT